MGKFNKSFVCGVITLLIVSCGKSGDEDITVTDNFDDTLDSVSEYNVSGGACGKIVVDELKAALGKCQSLNNQNSIDECRKEVNSVMEWHYNQIDCDVLINNKKTRINKNYFSKINDELDKISSVSNNFKSGQCGIFVLNEFAHFYKNNVDFEKKLYSPMFLDKSRVLMEKYEGIDCKDSEGKHLNEEFFTRLNLDIQFSFTLKE